MAKTYYTTSEAAKVLAVSPDTVLKWVRAGKISSYRTPGGHARIPIEAVKALLPNGNKNPGVTSPIYPEANFRYCWDFNAGREGISKECLECIVYKSRARRCYEMKDIPEQFGHLHLFCQGGCDDCEYYRLTQDLETAVLIVSRNSGWLEEIVAESEKSDLHIYGAIDEYECSARIEKLRPDYIVIDCAYGVSRTKNFCRNLTNDNRVPYTRIILTSRTPRLKGYCESAIFGWLRKPFKFEELALCIKRVKDSQTVLSPSSGDKQIMH